MACLFKNRQRGYITRQSVSFFFFFWKERKSEGGKVLRPVTAKAFHWFRRTGQWARQLSALRRRSLEMEDSHSTPPPTGLVYWSEWPLKLNIVSPTVLQATSRPRACAISNLSDSKTSICATLFVLTGKTTTRLRIIASD